MFANPRAALTALAASLIVAVTMAIAVYAPAQRALLAGDFRAFYCAAQVRLHGGNPYEAQLLSQCESQAAPPPLFTARRGEVLPAPLPGYLVAAFVPFALLPFPIAAILWALLSCAACALAVVVLARLGLGSTAVLAAVFAIPLCAVCLPVGELPPFSLLGVALLALAVKERRPWLCALGLALTMAEPQAGIVASVALLALRPVYWPYVIGTFVVLGASSVATLGVDANMQYVQTVLPAHLSAELPRVTQYSLSWMLGSLGVPASVALAFGRLWYAAMIVVAIVIARSKLAGRFSEFAVFGAVACAVTLGPFVHLDHIVLALPAALWIAARKERQGVATLIAAIVLALPLLYILSRPLLMLPGICAAGWTAAYYGQNRDWGLRGAAIAAVAIVAVEILALKAGVGARALGGGAPIALAAQDSWARYIRAHDVMTGWTLWAIKSPTWYGVLATASVALFSSCRKD